MLEPYWIVSIAIVVAVFAYLLLFIWRLNRDADAPGMDEMARFFLDRDAACMTENYVVVVIDYDPGVYFASVAGKRVAEIKGFENADEAKRFALEVSNAKDEDLHAFLFEKRRYVGSFHAGKEAR